MKSVNDSQIVHPFVGSILSWIGTDSQCLAAPHTHISTLEPDQLTHLCFTNITCETREKTHFSEKLAFISRTSVTMTVTSQPRGISQNSNTIDAVVIEMSNNRQKGKSHEEILWAEQSIG